MDNIFLGAIAGVAIGIGVIVLYAKWQVARLQYSVDSAATDLLAGLKAVDSRPHVMCRIEEVNGIFYVFDRDTNKFLVQGTTAVEIAQLLDAQYPNGIVVNLVESVDNALDKLEATQTS